MSVPKLIIIGGTTASGKTAFAVDTAIKENGEVVSCDSMQIYKKMDIGTAKVTKEEMRGIPHHMIDIIEPHTSYSVSEYKSSAEAIILDIISRGKTPILVGGTGLYISSIMYDMTYGGTEKNDEIRNKYIEIEKNLGKKYLYDLLSERDSASAAKLHENDVKRVIRALEILDGGMPKRSNEEVLTTKYDISLFVLTYDRPTLYQNINDRVDKMFECGLTEEIKNLLTGGVTFENQSMAAIGYREFNDFFSGNSDLDTVKENIKKHSRNFAKRQLTWFKRYKNAQWLDPLATDLTKFDVFSNNSSDNELFNKINLRTVENDDR